MNDLTTTEIGMSLQDVVQQKKRVAELMQKVLKEGEHYGAIPGTKKKTLYKSGAEVIAMTFGIHPKLEIQKNDLGDGHREYEVICTMYRNTDGMVLASGVGSCSTMESKYRWRTNKKINPETGQQEEQKVPNPNIEDLHNTVLKMAKKRAFVDAVITATSASDFVTQDIEDFEKEEPVEPIEEWENEIEAINNIEHLKEYYMINSGKGAKFAKKVTERKEYLEKNNLTNNDHPQS